MDVSQEDYNDLLRQYNKLEFNYDKLYDKYLKLKSDLENSEFKIKSELEPRINAEKKQYDSYVLNGGSDICFRNGTAGMCNDLCELYGTKECEMGEGE